VLWMVIEKPVPDQFYTRELGYELYTRELGWVRLDGWGRWWPRDLGG
jgi:hypothetical protein